ncbi:MAG TPA: LLM class flavin-dependent oxidoreductase [Pseudonocardiaceae bacterium]|nr:LLM class flavin-dependent oxidoreductase [Pseudonocardiaceae bacterium]
MDDTRRLRFHWSLSAVGDAKRRGEAQEAMSGAFDLATHTEFCRAAESCGIESLLMAFGFTRPDPFTWSAALGSRTEKINFLTAIRSGVCSPTLFVQQVNTLSVVTGGRVYINIVAGRAPGEQRYYGDFLDHDERYERTDEFWQICHALWRGDGPVDFTGRHYRVEGARINTPFRSAERDRPKIYLGGNSEQAVGLAIRHADCLLTFPEAPKQLAERIRPVLDAGKKVGLLVSMIAKPTRDEAVAAAAELVAKAGDGARQVHRNARGGTDSVGFRSMYDTAENGSAWVTPYLWTGAVPYLGPPAISLVGSATDLVEAIFEYRDVGVTEFLFTGFPDLAQMRFFAAEILPRVRERERASMPTA